MKKIKRCSCIDEYGDVKAVCYAIAVEKLELRIEQLEKDKTELMQALDSTLDLMSNEVENGYYGMEACTLYDIAKNIYRKYYDKS